MIGDNERDILKEFGKHLKKLREERDLSFREFSRLSGVNKGDIVKYENGESGPNMDKTNYIDPISPTYNILLDIRYSAF